ncbi:hypothetical protein ACQV2B_08855 [Pantoea allii]|uniref:hypothetical protein n=1 Tax=Pantoea allii TaxID=574096 RepID=UPI003977BDA9
MSLSSTIKGRKTYVIGLLISFTLALIYFNHGKAYTGMPSQYYIFHLSGEKSSIYMSNFLPEKASYTSNFSDGFVYRGKGPVNVNGRSPKPFNTYSQNEFSISIYNVNKNDKICFADTCTVSHEPQNFAVVDDHGLITASFSKIYLDRSVTAVGKGINIYSSTPQDLLIYNIDNGVLEIANNVSTKHGWLLPYSKAFDSDYKKCWLLISTIVFFIIVNFLYASRKEIYNILIRDNLKLLGVLIFTIGFLYLSVFPAVYRSDSVIYYINNDLFSEWYTPVYMFYSYIIYFLSPDLILLPTLLLFTCAFLSLGKFCKEVSLKLYHQYILVNIIILLSMPFVFISLFGVQRYFTAIVFLLSGMIFYYTAYAYAKFKKINSFKLTLLGGFLLVIAAAMRSEYLPFSVAFIFLFFPEFQKKPINTYRKTAFCFLFAVLTLSINPVIGKFTSNIYSYDRDELSLDYRLASLTSLTATISQCPAQANSLYDHYFGNYINQRTVCQLNGDMESVYWQKIKGLPVSTKDEISRKIIEVMPELIANHPRAFMDYFINRAIELISHPEWNIVNKYTVDSPIIQIIVADRNDAYRENLLGEKVYNKVINYFITLGNFNFEYMLVALLLVIIAFPLLFKRMWRYQIVNLVSLVIAALVVIASPTSNQWAYLLIIPVWCCIGAVLFYIERYSMHALKSHSY